ncbi:MAG: hypothetical protein M3460_22075 [Actinomycetota bacterium]|nr:hypothetical protein [Actinomycetota bacterium]
MSLGAHADVVGLRIADLDPRFVRKLIEEFPHLDFPNEFLQALFENVRKKPSRASGNFPEGIGRAIEVLANNPLDAM